MTDFVRRPLDDDSLIAALRDVGGEIDWPGDVAGPDLALRVRVRIADRGPAATARPRWRPARLGLILALVALLALAAAAGAMVLGVPGLRITLGDPGVSPSTAAPSAGAPGASAPAGSASAQPPGARLGLGVPTSLNEAVAAVDRPIRMPSDPTVGPPDAVYVDVDKGKAVTLVWSPTDALPPTLAADAGLVLVSFDGTLDDGYFQKIAGSGSTVEPVRVGGHRGFWISGDAHIFFFEDGDGNFVDDERRWVGDALVWTDGSTTYRLETAAGKDAAVRIAKSLE